MGIWHDVQITIFDPGVTGNLTFTTNGPNYRVRGAETSVVARVTEGLTITASGAWNSSEVVKTLSLVDPKTGQPINVSNPFGALVTPLAQSPPFQGNIRARYEFPVREYHAFVQAAAVRQGGSYATTDRLSSTLQGNSEAFYDPGFTTYNAAAGVARDAWTVQAYCDNLTDVQGDLYSFYTLFVKANTISRPRTAGVRLSFKF
jgi:iron complex outermembrane recepter protein